MKYHKLIAKYFAEKSKNNAQIAIALVAGLAAGTVISVLFARNSGDDTRERITRGARNLKYGVQDKLNALREKAFGIEAVEQEITEHQLPHIKDAAKKPKSNIKDLVAEAHQNGQIQEGLG